MHIQAWENSNLLRKVQRRQHKKELYIYIMNFQLSLTLLTFNFVKMDFKHIKMHLLKEHKHSPPLPPPQKSAWWNCFWNFQRGNIRRISYLNIIMFEMLFYDKKVNLRRGEKFAWNGCNCQFHSRKSDKLGSNLSILKWLTDKTNGNSPSKPSVGYLCPLIVQYLFNFLRQILKMTKLSVFIIK